MKFNPLLINGHLVEHTWIILETVGFDFAFIVLLILHLMIVILSF